MRIELKDAVPGAILANEITRESTKLVSKGQVLTASLKNKLEMFGITYIDIVSDELEETAEEIVNGALMNRIKGALKDGNITQIKALTTDMISSILKSVSSDDNFSNLKYDLETYENRDSLDHSVRTAIFSIALAYLYNKNVKSNVKNGDVDKNVLNIYDVGLAALLQDKGKNHYSSGVLSQIDEMAHNEKFVTIFPELENIPTDRFEDKYIPYYSFCLISKMPDVSRDVKVMVLYSSQEDKNLKAKTPNGDKNSYIGSQIIRLCNLYDLLLSHFYHMHESFENITTYLGQAMTTGSINEELLNIFLSEIPLYPIGAKVKLSDGTDATVIKNFPGYAYTTKPMVKTTSGKRIDLRSKTDITISSLSNNEASLDKIVDTQANIHKTA